jgi:hypothetical protein
VVQRRHQLGERLEPDRAFSGRHRHLPRSPAFRPPLGKGGIDRELKKLRDAIGAHPALTFLKNQSRTIGGFGLNDRFSYAQRLGGPGEVANRVLVEAGAASGWEPTAWVELRSYLGQFLQETGVSLGADDEGPFGLRLLHFRRTFVEKMFACSSATASRSELTRGTITTCFNSPRARK